MAAAEFTELISKMSPCDPDHMLRRIQICDRPSHQAWSINRTDFFSLRAPICPTYRDQQKHHTQKIQILTLSKILIESPRLFFFSFLTSSTVMFLKACDEERARGKYTFNNLDSTAQNGVVRIQNQQSWKSNTTTTSAVFFCNKVENQKLGVHSCPARSKKSPVRSEPTCFGRQLRKHV